MCGFSIASAERGAHLVAVERAMAGAAMPARALARPGVGMRVRSARSRRSGCRCSRRGRAGSTRWSRRRGSGGSRSLRRRAAPARSGLPSPAAIESPSPAISTSRTWISVTTRWAVPSGSAMSTVAVVGRPCTTRSRISSSHEPANCRGSLDPSSNVQTQLTASAGAAGEHDADAMVAGRQIDFARAVALADLHQPAGAIDAQALDRVARPAAAVALDRKPPLGAEHAVVAPGRRRGAGNRLRCGTGGSGS